MGLKGSIVCAGVDEIEEIAGYNPLSVIEDDFLTAYKIAKIFVYDPKDTVWQPFAVQILAFLELTHETLPEIVAALDNITGINILAKNLSKDHPAYSLGVMINGMEIRQEVPAVALVKKSLQEISIPATIEEWKELIS